MNMLPINAEWKHRQQWADKQRRKQPSSNQTNERTNEQARKNIHGK